MAVLPSWSLPRPDGDRARASCTRATPVTDARSARRASDPSRLGTRSGLPRDRDLIHNGRVDVDVLLVCRDGDDECVARLLSQISLSSWRKRHQPLTGQIAIACLSARLAAVPRHTSLWIEPRVRKRPRSHLSRSPLPDTSSPSSRAAAFTRSSSFQMGRRASVTWKDEETGLDQFLRGIPMASVTVTVESSLVPVRDNVLLPPAGSVSWVIRG